MTRPSATGWRSLVLATAAFLIVPSLPTLRSVVPITQTWVLLAAALAVCAALGWWNGGGARAAVLAAVAGGIAIGSPLVGVGGYAEMARGWTLLLAASFGIASLLTPGVRFLPRALSATGIALAAGAALAVASARGASAVSQVAIVEYTQRTDATLRVWRELTSTPRWREAAARSPQLTRMAEESERELIALPPVGARLLPAILGLESLAALALAWALYHRSGLPAIGPLLAPVREFRFNDQLVWGFAVGATMYVLPGFDGLRGAGANLLFFFGALYLLRGIGVLSWVSRGRWVGALLIVLTIFAPVLLAALAMAVGIADTWMDWRSRARPAT